VIAPLLAFALGPFGGAPLGLYALLVILQTLLSMPARGIGRSLLAVPLLAASHVFYGLGFWRGLTTKLKAPGGKSATEVKIDPMPPQTPT
jgi:hypothetical protein